MKQNEYDNFIKIKGIKPKLIKIYRTTHSSPIIENRENGNFVAAFVDCDKFLGENIRLNFLENGF